MHDITRIYYYKADTGTEHLDVRVSVLPVFPQLSPSETQKIAQEYSGFLYLYGNNRGAHRALECRDTGSWRPHLGPQERQNGQNEVRPPLLELSAHAVSAVRRAWGRRGGLPCVHARPKRLKRAGVHC